MVTLLAVGTAAYAQTASSMNSDSQNTKQIIGEWESTGGSAKSEPQNKQIIGEWEATGGSAQREPENEPVIGQWDTTGGSAVAPTHHH